MSRKIETRNTVYKVQCRCILVLAQVPDASTCSTARTLSGSTLSPSAAKQSLISLFCLKFSAFSFMFFFRHLSKNCVIVMPSFCVFPCSVTSAVYTDKKHCLTPVRDFSWMFQVNEHNVATGRTVHLEFDDAKKACLHIEAECPL